VSDDTGVIGALVTEQRLPRLDPTGATAARLGATGEAALCAGAGAVDMDCFPLRGLARPSRLTRLLDGHLRPMEHALRGETGIALGTDYRRHRVLAAYAPVEDTGLGVVVKKDVAEIYAPIRRQFERIVVFLALLLALGIWVMRRRLRPLLRRLEKTRAQARASGARLEAAVESNLDAFFLFECERDAGGRLRDMRYVLLNARGEHTLQRPRDQIIGRGMCELFPALREDGLLADFQHVVDTGEALVRVRQSVLRDQRWLHMQIVPVGDGIGLTVRDVTADRLSADKLRHQAMHDPLTGLANRAGLEAALAAAMADAGRTGTVAVALLDLDGFKQVNDSLGHAAGDHLLQEVATRLRDGLRPSDTVARLGGDEFALVLTAIDYPAGAQVVAEKLVALLAQPMLIDDHPVAITASIGLCQYPRDGADAASLLRCADAAMYRSKRAGRNGFTLHAAEPALPG
jgi:diguanylate cyclase (GGDEF)-like protein